MNIKDYPVNDFDLEMNLISRGFNKIRDNCYVLKNVYINLLDQNNKSRCGYTKIGIRVNKHKTFQHKIPHTLEESNLLFNFYKSVLWQEEQR